jgi:outer membrane protein OmpA-like peptidoglycan-associated protein
MSTTKTYFQIVNELNNHRSLIIENKELLNESIIGTLKKYFQRGVLTTTLIASLLSANQVSAGDLKAAGVPENTIENVLSTNNELKSIESQLIKILSNRGDKGLVKKYNSLDEFSKVNILNKLKERFGNNIGDLKNFNLDIQASDRALAGPQFTKINTTETKVVKFVADTVNVSTSFDFKYTFEANSYEFKEDPTSTIKEMLDSFFEITKITVKTSSSTLRNTNGMTWLELSEARANAIAEVVKNIEHNNPATNSPKVNLNDITSIDFTGDNGDGTSGPKSPYEVSQAHIDYYNSQDIDPIYWKSKANEAPLENIEDYEQFQKVEIIVEGIVLSDVPKEVEETLTTYSYLILKAKEKGLRPKENSVKPAPKRNVVCPIKA